MRYRAFLTDFTGSVYIVNADLEKEAHFEYVKKASITANLKERVPGLTVLIFRVARG